MNHKISKILINYFNTINKKSLYKKITIGNSIFGKGFGVGKINGFLSSASKCIIDPLSK